MISSRRHIFLVFLFVFLLSGCSSQPNNSNYVDLDSAVQKIEENKLDIQSKDFTYDKKPYNIMKMDSTIDADYYYIFQESNMKINLQSGRIQSVCTLPGCAHTYRSPNCIGYQEFISPVATTNGIYYVQDNQIMLFHDSTEDIILENDYFTDYEKETYPDNKSIISALTIYNDTLYAICPTYFFTYNLQTEEITKPQKLCESLCMSLAATEEYLYYSTDSLELYQYNLKTDTIVKLDDKVGQVSISDEQVYYIKYEEEVPVLCTMNKDGTNAKKLIENCWVNYYIKDEYIYYQSFNKNNDLYVSRLDGSGKQQIKLKYDESELTNLVKIISIDALDQIFMIDEIENVIFVFEKGSTVYRVIAIEEE